MLIQPTSLLNLNLLPYFGISLLRQLESPEPVEVKGHVHIFNEFQ